MSNENEPGMAYNTKKLNKVFFFLSLAFLMTVLWVFLDDYIRPWKSFQIKAMKIEREAISQKIQEAKKELDEKKLEELRADLVKANKTVAARKENIEKLKKEVARIGVKIKDETIVNGRLNSFVSATTFKWEKAHAHHKPGAKKLFKTLQNLKKDFALSKDRMKQLTEKEKSKERELSGLYAEVTKTEKSIGDITKQIDLLKLAKEKTKKDHVFFMRNLPFLDFMDPTLKIHQVVAKNITDDRYFQHVPKVDRCMTCHVFIDKAGYEDRPNPYKTHPELSLMVGAKSPHPMKEYGCTTCHGGEGHRVFDFNAAAHTPRNEKQKKEWIKKYGWHAPHKIPQPMFRVGHTEAGCIKCHQDVEFIPSAGIVNQGRQNMEKYGCYGCHKIEGWEHKRRPGPSLKKIASKVDKEFFKNWVWSPKNFNQHAMMPSFFMQSNNSRKDFTLKNIAEVNSMTEYIWQKSQNYKPFEKYAKGSKERGKELIKTVGCMACHGVEGLDEESRKVGAYAGPYLTATGSKIKNPDWLVSWLKRPSHYQKDTIMPSFRLTTREANDIATYLLSLKNKTFEELRFEPLDSQLRDELLVEYLSAFDTLKTARNKVARMSPHERTLELGRRSVAKYGCYSCHEIDGFDNRAPIGPELTNIGSKPLTQFGFGHEHHIEHSREGWIVAHLKNPRRWDKGIDRPFKDLLRMPHFNMSAEEIESITVALLGQVSDYIPIGGIKRLDAHESIAAVGAKVLNKYNCYGCHKIDGMRGDIGTLYEDDLNEGPPWLVDQGHRTQADWLYHFLGNVRPIRPWLKIRMPSYNLSDEEKNKIVMGFQTGAKQPTFVDNNAKVVWKPGERAAAIKLFKELECASCHTGGFSREEATAPDLHLSKRRLRPDWIKKWISNPHAILEYTTMTNFWEGGESFEETILDGNPQAQQEALVKYLRELGKDKL